MIEHDWISFANPAELVDFDTEKVSFPIFSLSKLDYYCTNNLQEIRTEIEQMEENYVLNVNEAECVEYLIKKYLVDAPSIDFESATISHREENVLTEPSLIITHNLPL